MNVPLEHLMDMAAPAPVHRSSCLIPNKRATELRTLRVNTLAFIEKCGGIERAADALLSTPDRQQRHADMRERHAQGPHYSVEAEDAFDVMDFLDESVDAKLIALKEAAAGPELPKIQGKIGAIFVLADAGRSAGQIADPMGLTRRRISQILTDAAGIRREVEAEAARKSSLPQLTLDDICSRTPIKKPRKPKPRTGRQRWAMAPAGDEGGLI